MSSREVIPDKDILPDDLSNNVKTDFTQLEVETDQAAVLRKQFGLLPALGLAFVILNSWASTAASLNLALPSGGPVAVIWGELAAGVGSLAIAASLAEFCSIWPSTGGQYHWTYHIMKGTSWENSFSYLDGWLSALGWWAMYGSSGALPTNLIFNIISLWKSDFLPKSWHFFLFFVAFIAGSGALNLYGTRYLHMIDRVAFFWSIVCALICVVAVAAVAAPNYQSGEFVFTTFVNQTGWNDFAAFVLGMLQGCFGLTTFDSVAHIVEEMPNPRRDAPRVMVGAVLIGVSTTFIFLLVLLFAITDIDAVVSSSTGPLLTIFYQATGTKAGATALLMLPLVTIVFSGQGVLTTASRMTWSLACDKALPAYRWVARVSQKREAPLFAIAWAWGFAFGLGLLYLASTATFNAIISSSVVALTCSYCVPIALVLIRGRRKVPNYRPSFNLGNFFGPLCNAVAVLFGLFISIMFLLPPDRPVTGTTMNYTAAVFGVVGIVAVLNWVFSAREMYKGPAEAMIE